MAVATYTKSGAKASTPVILDKDVFGVEIKNHQLLKDAYLTYLAKGRTNNAVTKKRGEVRGGGRKPYRQKGTGRARFGSSRNPIWRSGGVAFGPTGNENYTRNLNVAAKRQALRQVLSIAAKEDRVKVIEAFSVTDGKTKSANAFLTKLGASGNILLVLASKDSKAIKAANNISGLKLVSANYLNMFDVSNADEMIIEKAALESISAWLGGK
jgi:large subunit ribosomal protein L4